MFALVQSVVPTNPLVGEIVFSYLYSCCTLGGASFSEEGYAVFMCDYVNSYKKSLRS